MKEASLLWLGVVIVGKCTIDMGCWCKVSADGRGRLRGPPPKMRLLLEMRPSIDGA